jgi:hypothetical protein
MLRAVRDRAATRALVLGLLSLPFGLLSPFAIWSATGSLRRSPSARALIGLLGGLAGLGFLIAGGVYWLLTS